MTVTLEDLNTILNNTYRQEFLLPDLSQNPYIINMVSLKNQQFYFEYMWNIRDGRAYLSIYKIQDSEKDYYLKNRRLINNINLSKYIRKMDWTGGLYFTSVIQDYKQDYDITTLSENFKLVYITGKDEV